MRGYLATIAAYASLLAVKMNGYKLGDPNYRKISLLSVSSKPVFNATETIFVKQAIDHLVRESNFYDAPHS